MNNILSKFAILLLAVMPLAANVAGQNSVYGISSGGYISTWVTNNPVCSCDKMMNVAVQGTIHSASPWNVSISNDTFSPTSAYVSPNKTYYILYDVCR